MKKPLFLLVIAISASAHAEVTDPYRVRCLSAAGYYANIGAVETDRGELRVTAAQGYAHELSQKLLESGSEGWSVIRVAFAPNECQRRGEAIVCSATKTRFIAEKLDGSRVQFLADARFSVIESREEGLKSHRVTLGIKPRSGGGVAKMIDFGARSGVAHEGLGACVF